MKNHYSLSETAEMLSVSKETLRRWDQSGQLKSTRLPNNYRVYTAQTLKSATNGLGIFDLEIFDENHYTPIKPYSVLELFAGAGGMALGMEKAGLSCRLLNELDSWACKTLMKNRPEWNVIEGDVSKLCFKQYQGSIDVVTGGFPCQSFSYAGKSSD